MPPFTTSCIVLALYTSAYCTEIVRGAIDAVPMVTQRAARSLGLTWGQDMTHIVFPMALRVALPELDRADAGGDEKNSALVGWLGVLEFVKQSQTLITRLQEPMFILIVAGGIYFLISFPIAHRWAANLKNGGARMIEIQNVRKSFGPLEVLKGIDLTVKKGEVVSVIGGSGSGKSTLLTCINGLEPINAGKILVDGIEVHAKTTDLNKLRRKIGIVFSNSTRFHI